MTPASNLTRTMKRRGFTSLRVLPRRQRDCTSSSKTPGILAIQYTSAPIIDIYHDVSRTDHVKDLRKRSHKRVLVRRYGVDVGLEVAKNHDKVEIMDPMINKYCDLYTKDLTKRVGLDDRFLSPIFITHVLLNPMFSLKKRFVNYGILTYDQYQRGKLSESCIHNAYVCPKTLLLFHYHP